MADVTGVKISKLTANNSITGAAVFPHTQGSTTKKVTLTNVANFVNATMKAMITDVEASSTAAKAYAVGDSLILGNTLYKVTAAIAIGDTITAGTNVTATTVTALIADGGGSSLPAASGVNF